MATKDKIEVVEINEEDTLGRSIITLKNPVEYEGVTYDKLVFNWEGLTGDDYQKIEKELTARGVTVIMAEFDTEFIMTMAVRACTSNVDANFFKRLPLPAFNKIRSKGRSFLLNSEA